MIYDRLLTQYIQFYIMNAIYISRADNPAAITNLMNCYHMEGKKKRKNTHIRNFRFPAVLTAALALNFVPYVN